MPPRILSPATTRLSSLAQHISTNTMATNPTRRISRTALFICDIQEKFRPAIWEYEKIITTTQKMLKVASILKIPVYATTQNAARLGPTCTELLPLLTNTVEHAEKLAFSMWIPEISRHFSSPSTVVIVGIESHICVTQTALDLLKEGHKVYILADGVSSCNKEEVPIALARLRREGCTITSSESFIFECMGSAGIEEFKQVSGVIKEFGPRTKEGMATLCKI